MPLNFGKIFSMSPKAILMWCDASEKSTLKLGACCCGLVTGWENKKVEAVGFNGSGWDAEGELGISLASNSWMMSAKLFQLWPINITLQDKIQNENSTDPISDSLFSAKVWWKLLKTGNAHKINLARAFTSLSV